MRPVVIVAVSLLAACETEGGPKGPVEAQPGVVAGQVVDMAGEPVAGAEVVIDDQLHYDANLITVTDEDGLYSLELPDEAVTWHATATHTVEYHDRTYRFDLHPEVDDPFVADDGAVRNFEWRLSGEKPDGLGYYGGYVVGYSEPGDFSFEIGDVTLTLEPDGPLVDGSEGEAITGPLVSTADGDAIVDVPVGRYVISAALPGGPLEIRLGDAGGAYADTVTADFELPYGDLPIYRIEVELRRP